MLSVTPTLTPSGSLWLLLTLSGFHWLSLALTRSLPVSLWLSMALCDCHSGSHWLSLPLFGILWPSLAHYCSPILRIQPLIGSQGLCSALIVDATMKHFIPLCMSSWYSHTAVSNKIKLYYLSTISFYLGMLLLNTDVFVFAYHHHFQAADIGSTWRG